MVTNSRIAHIDLEEALAKGPPPPGNLAVPVFSHGSLVVEIYTPAGHDPQKPHTRDEVYVVVTGSGEFFNGGRTERFGSGDVLFVPAHVDHRFERFTDDLVVWVIFYGPEGGEVAVAGAP